MGSAKRRQYLLALAIGLAAFAWQAYAMLRSLALDSIDSNTAILQQLLRRLFDDRGALLTVLVYLLVAVVSHLLLTLAAMAMYRTALARWLPRYMDSTGAGIAFVCLSLLAAVFLSRLAFPMSRAFAGAELLMLQPASPLLVWGSLLLVGLTCLAAIVELARRRWRVAAAIAMVLGLSCAFFGSMDSGMPSDRERPDIIVLGVDSLRPDFLPAFGFKWPGLTPNINAAIGGSVVFLDAKTPLARTFPSYMSLLTGSDPREHRARFNLYPRSEFSRSGTIAHLLQEDGYHAVFAMDDSRFANFDESFGFDEMVAPPVGALDFIIGSGYDFLATNLLLTIPSVNKLFSHIYGNRAAFRTYRVADHPQRVVEAIRRSPGGKPLFLVSHLCLPHWPYVPVNVLERDLIGPRVSALEGFEDAPPPYVRALAEVDQQFRVIMDGLRNSGRLNNAILVVISDHGESLGMSREAFRNLEDGGRSVNFHGHGGFALSDSQNSIVLAMQHYRDGKPLWAPRKVSGEASIVDVAPTIIDLAGHGKKWEALERSGVSLWAFLEDGSSAMPSRTLFVETGIRSGGVEKPHIDEREVASEMIHLYRIEPDLRLEIRPQLLNRHLAQKQRGAVRGRLGVATFPSSHPPSAAGACWLVADYEERTLGCSGYPSSDPQVAELQESVCTHFAGDKGFDEEWCAEGSKR